MVDIQREHSHLDKGRADAYFVLELLYGISGTADGVAHFAHIGGMVFGFLLLLYWKRRGVFDNRWFL